MQAQKELNESTSDFLKQNFPYPDPQNRHERRANDRHQKKDDYEFRRNEKRLAMAERDRLKNF